MPTPGKNFPGQKGFPTPNSTPDDTVRRIFVVPNSDEWLGLLEGAVQVLLDEWRYYDWGAMTPAEAASAFNSIVLASYANVCPGVPNSVPRIIRLNPDTGAVEEVGEDGEWQPSTGDYAVPAVPPRETDPVCLAAANAANVLQILYEDLSDYWNSELTADEAATNFLLAVAALIAAPFGLVGEAIVAIAALVFRVAYELLEFITADLWTSDFTANLVCILVDCASNVDGVVTFDYECFNNKLAAQTNVFDLTASQLRLFGQIQWMLNTIGGVDALNSAGATTAITDYDCSGCAPSCGLLVTFDPGDPFTIIAYGSGVTWGDGTLDEGFGEPAPSVTSAFGTDGVSPGFGLAVELDLGAPTSVDGVNWRYWYFRDDVIDALYTEVTLLDADHVFVNNGVVVPEGGQGEWHGIVSPVAGADVRYVQIRLAGSGDGMTEGAAWLDNVCINPS